MKLYLDKNIAKGTPEELAKYKELISNHQLDRLEEVSEELRGDLGYKPFTVQEPIEDEPKYKSKAFYLLKDHIVLKHIEENSFESSKGDVWTIREDSDFITLANKESDDFEHYEKVLQERFDFAKQLGITLYKDTDFAVEAEGKMFRVIGHDKDFSLGHLVKIVQDDEYDRLPTVEGVISNKRNIIYFHNLELVEGQKSEENFDSFISSTDEEQSPSKELKVGDRVKVLKSECGAVGEATVSAVLEDGDVELAGTSKSGKYLDNWSNHVSNLEKIEEESPALEDHKYYEVIDTKGFADRIEEGTVVKVGDYNHLFNCITSDGVRQIANPDELKPLKGSHIEDRFKFAEMTGVRLTTSTDLAEDCKDHLFQLTHDDSYSGSAFSKGTVVKIDYDDGSPMPRFKDEEHVQFVFLRALKEIDRPIK